MRGQFPVPPKLSCSSVSTHLLAESHDLEALEVGELLPLDGALTVLCPCAGVPGGLDSGLLPGSLEGGVASGTGELGNNNGGKRNVGERDGVARDDSLGLGGRTLNKDLFPMCKSNCSA